ncbi:MAG: hypothetical protein MJ191_06825 [Clostridium sp.]|nr:hypothetical protein [Clostridium sp.]
MDKDCRINIRVSKKDKEAIKAFGKQYNLSISQLMIYCTLRYIKESELHELEHEEEE